MNRTVAALSGLALVAALAPARSAVADSMSVPTPTAIAWANRVTWGINHAALAPDGTAWRQLTALDPTLPEAAQARISAMRISREPLLAIEAEIVERQQAMSQISDRAQRDAAREAINQTAVAIYGEARTRSILRDLYSPAQLREQMTWFWFNHFNVQGANPDFIVLVGDYENTLRTHALGRFRDLLGASLHHPAMLRYLNNEQNAVGRINENYAREIMELHTMGVGGGYSQRDVQELARILTGVGFSVKPGPPRLTSGQQTYYRRDGLFEFNPARHDFGTKHFLGRTIAGVGMAEVDQALDILATSPATSHHVSLRLATYFFGRSPPPALVDRMARTFLRSGGDMDAVLRTLVDAPEYRASLGATLKDPVHYVISAIRLGYEGKVIENAEPIMRWITDLGEGLYGRGTPDGYPLEASAWSGPSQMEARFEVARQIGLSSAKLFRPPALGAAERPAFPLFQNALYFGGLVRTLSPESRAALDQADSPQEWNMLYLSSPEFMRR